MKDNKDGTVTYTLEDLQAMTPEELAALNARIKAAGDQVKYMGTAVVRDKDGNVKYDDPSKAGTFGEKSGER